MEIEKAHPLLTLLQELESMKKRKRNMLEDERSSSMSSVVNTKIIQTREPHESEGRDLLSNLPDSLIHHIFSFLHLNDLVRLAVLSTRFRNLSITSPTLNFSLNLPCHPQNRTVITCSSCTSFLSYITNLLHQRQSSFPIRRLSFFCCTYNSEACTQHFQAHKQWIEHALTTYHVEELLLEFLRGPITNLRSAHPHPQWLFLLNSQCSLKSLVLVLSNETLKLPEEVTLLSLHTLFLEDIIVDASSAPIDEWVCKSFPNLKRLALKIIYGATTCLNIQSTCIESLTIENQGCLTSVIVHARNLRSFDFKTMALGSNMIKDLMMEIFAPNLEKLRWEGDARKQRWEGEMHVENLKDVCFNFQCYYDTSFPREKDFVSILRCVRCATRLCIDSRILKVFLEDPSNSFGNLRHLSVTMGFWRGDAKYIFPFLEKSPNLESLVIREAQYYYKGTSEGSLLNFLHDFEDDKVLPMILRSSLNSNRIGLKSIGGVKKVEIKISTFYKEIILMIGMAMKTCRDLENMTIKYPHYCEKWMTQLGVQDAIQSFDRASSSLQLFMLPTNYIPLHCPCERERFE